MFEIRRTIVRAVETLTLTQPGAADLDLPTVLHALSDPVRLEIVQELYASDGERACGSFEVPVAKSTLTHHFRVLREAGIICQRHSGTSRMSKLRREDLERRFPGLLAAVTRDAVL
jgi:DNA-binding transcriptional ArsR family regulator